MKNRFYTLLVIPEKSTKVRKIVLPKPAFIVFSLMAIVLSFFLVFTVFRFSHLYVQVLESEEVRKENKELKLFYLEIANKLNSLDSSVERMKTMASKLRHIVNLPKSDNNDMLLANETFPNINNQLIKDTMTSLENSMENSLKQENYLERTYQLLQDKTQILARTPSVIPTKGYIASTFGYRHHPVHGRWIMHEGLDFAAFPGTNIIATADGVVNFAGMRGSFGKVVVIDHGYGIKTLYAHNKRLFVKVGDLVKRGQKIASVGKTGVATGAHLHYEVRINDVPVDPANYILNDIRMAGP